MFFSAQESGLGAQMRSCLGEKFIGSFHLGHTLGSGPTPVPNFLAWVPQVLPVKTRSFGSSSSLRHCPA